MIKPTKEEIIELLNKSSLDDMTLEAVHNLIKVDPLNIRYVSDYLQKLEFIEHLKLSHDLCMMDHSGVLDRIIDKTIVEKDFPREKRFNLIDLCNSKGILVDVGLFKYLLDFKPESHIIIGKGETLMRILMKGVPTLNGDLGASGKKFEIKYNKSRLRGQTGFDATDATQVAKALDDYFIHECKAIKFDPTSLIGTDRGRWNFVSGKRIKPYLLSEIVKQSGMNHLYACKIFVQAFRKFFTKMTEDEALNLALSLSNEFNPDGSIKERFGYSDFIYKMCAYSMKYYAQVEDFDGMLILNDKFDCMYITREFIDTSSLEVLCRFIRHNLEITTPNLGSKAGPQGSSFGISL